MPRTPDLDEHCSRFFTYRDLVECGKTWGDLSNRTHPGSATFDNTPRRMATFKAIARLARDVLDPVREHFGELVLTYGFASTALSRQIRRRIAPALDQHAGHEIGPRGALICRRLGQAADFAVPRTSSRDVVVWVAAHTPFDRLYYYGDDHPIHVSVGPEHSRQFCRMRTSNTGRLFPQVMDPQNL